MDISQQALLRVHELMALELSKHYLRVYIQGGGCSGFQYGFEIEEQLQADDHVFEHSLGELSIILIIDPISMNYLKNGTLDYKKDIMGQRFVVHNSHVKTTCGCGQSFSLELAKE